LCVNGIMTTRRGMGRRRDDYKLKFCITATKADLMLTERNKTNAKIDLCDLIEEFRQLDNLTRTVKSRQRLHIAIRMFILKVHRAA